VTIEEFKLVTGFTEHLEVANTSNYSANANSHTLQFTTACTKSFQFAVSSLVVVWYWLRTPYFPQLPCSRPYWPATVSQLPSTPLTAVSRLFHNGSCSSLYNLGTDRIENIYPRSRIAALRIYRIDRVENTASQLLHVACHESVA
jgi:hypothetical protein